MSETYTRSFGQLQRVREWDPMLGGFERDKSGLFLPIEARPQYPTAIDLFSGAGGFSLGFHQAGFHVIGALEFDPWPVLTYLTNLGAPSTRIYFIEEGDKAKLEKALRTQRKLDAKSGRNADLDIRLIDRGDGTFSWPGASMSDYANEEHRASRKANGECVEPLEVMFMGNAKKISGYTMLRVLGVERGSVHAVCGGPPCQGFSVAGTRNVYDERNSLVLDFARIIVDIRPKTWVMENVPGILSMKMADGVPVVDKLCNLMGDHGWGSAEAIRTMLAASSGAGKVETVRPGPKHPSRGGKSKKAAAQDMLDLMNDDENLEDEVEEEIQAEAPAPRQMGLGLVAREVA